MSLIFFFFIPPILLSTPIITTSCLPKLIIKNLSHNGRIASMVSYPIHNKGRQGKKTDVADP